MANNRLRLTPPPRPRLKLFGVLLSPEDHRFIEVSAKRVGVGKSEFVRRIIHNERLRWIERGLYDWPRET
jgi:hypothetical protein